MNFFYVSWNWKCINKKAINFHSLAVLILVNIREYFTDLLHLLVILAYSFSFSGLSSFTRGVKRRCSTKFYTAISAYRGDDETELISRPSNDISRCSRDETCETETTSPLVNIWWLDHRKNLHVLHGAALWRCVHACIFIFLLVKLIKFFFSYHSLYCYQLWWIKIFIGGSKNLEDAGIPPPRDRNVADPWKYASPTRVTTPNLVILGQTVRW